MNLRRMLWVIAMALGSALLAGGPLMRWAVAPVLLAAPIDDYQVLTARTNDAAFVTPSTGVITPRGPAILTTTLRGDVAASSRSVAVVDVFTQLAKGTAVAPAGGPDVIATSKQRLAPGRRTGELSTCCGTNVDGYAGAQAGLRYAFPPHAERRDYDYFDPQTGTTYPAKFVKSLRISGNRDVDGLVLNQYHQDVPSATIGQREVPAALLGKKTGPAVTVERRYSAGRDIFVEPRTGIVVRLDEEIDLSLRPPGQTTGGIAEFKGSLVWTDETVSAAARRAKEQLSRALWLQTIVPIALSTTGALLLTGGCTGFWLAENRLRLRRRPQYDTWL